MDADLFADAADAPHIDPDELNLRAAIRQSVSARNASDWAFAQRALADYLEENYRVGEADAVRLERQPGCRWPSPDDLPGLSDHQKGALRVGLRAPVAVLTGTPGTGKAAPLDSRILTPTGWQMMGDVRPGDYAIGRDGMPCRVRGVFPQGVNDVYRVMFSDGASVECCGDHLWFTQTRYSRKVAQHRGYPLFRAGAVRSTTAILASLHASDGHRNHYIPLVAPVQFQATSHPLDPYLMGYLLGNGCFRQAATVALPDDARPLVEASLPTGARLVRRGERFDYGISGTGKVGGNPVLKAVRDLGLFGCGSPDKFIPDCYLFAPPLERLALLQGLLDSDGYAGGHHAEYCTTSSRLAEGVRFLAESFGGTASTAWKSQPTYSYLGETRRGRPAARIWVNLPPQFAPFRLPRKLANYQPHTKYLPARSIASVEPIGKKECQCIAVDAPDQLYVMDHCVVTHNTHCLAAIIKAIIQQETVHAIAIAAPTGKAAVRITEAMRRAGVGGLAPASTIHQLLQIGRNGHDNQGWGFRRNADNPLPSGFVFVDEASMIDTDLMSSLLLACRPCTHLLLVGDPHQLQPVGHGFPLRDLIASGRVPVAELTEIRRNAGAIVHQCATIREGRYRDFTALPYRPYPSYFLLDDNLQIYPARGPAEQQAAVVEMVRTYLVQVYGMPDTNGVQVLCATNKGSPISRHELNLALQAVCNPHGGSAGDSPFRLGDKVICTRNGWYMPAWDADDDEEVYVANGEIGRVVELRMGWAVVEFGPGANDGGDANDSKQARFLIGGRATNDDDSGGEVGAGDSEGESNWLQLAYAITGHKSQGSQWPVVIVALDGGIGAARICDRHWLYTAISRAEQLCVLVGDMRVARQMAMRDTASKRLTFLAEGLRNG